MQKLQGKDSLFDNTASIGVDPRALAQRIMDVRHRVCVCVRVMGACARAYNLCEVVGWPCSSQYLLLLFLGPDH